MAVLPWLRAIIFCERRATCYAKVKLTVPFSLYSSISARRRRHLRSHRVAYQNIFLSFAPVGLQCGRLSYSRVPSAIVSATFKIFRDGIGFEICMDSLILG